MRGATLCWIALAAGCGFEGSEGMMSGEPPTSSPTPQPKVRVFGVADSPEDYGSFSAFLLPAGSTLPADNPCEPAGARTTPVDWDSGELSFDEVTPGSYVLAVFRKNSDRSRLERTLVAVTVTGQDVDLGTIKLLEAIDAERKDVIGSGPMIFWAAPRMPSSVATKGYAYNVELPGQQPTACTPGVALPNVQGAYRVPAPPGPMTKVRAVVEVPLTGQLAIDIADES